MRTTQHKGDVAVSQAIARFTKMGYDVALPLTESAAYDLIVDTGEEYLIKQCLANRNSITPTAKYFIN